MTHVQTEKMESIFDSLHLKKIMTYIPICPCFDGDGCIKYFDCEPWITQIMPQLALGQDGALYCIQDLINQTGEKAILEEEEVIEGYLIVMNFLLKYKNQEQMQNELNERVQQAREAQGGEIDEWMVRNEWFVIIPQRTTPEIIEYIIYHNELKMEWLTCACLYKTLLSLEKRELELAEGDMKKVDVLLAHLRNLRG